MDVSKGEVLSNDILLTAYDKADKVIKTAVSVLLTAKIGSRAILFSWADRDRRKSESEVPNGGIIYIGSEAMSVELLSRSFEVFDNMSQPEAARLAVLLSVASEMSGKPLDNLLKEMSDYGHPSQN